MSPILLYLTDESLEKDAFTLEIRPISYNSLLNRRLFPKDLQIPADTKPD